MGQPAGTNASRAPSGMERPLGLANGRCAWDAVTTLILIDTQPEVKGYARLKYGLWNAVFELPITLGIFPCPQGSFGGADTEKEY